MTSINLFREHCVVEPIDRRLFTAKRRDTFKGVILAIGIGAGLALALVAWWSA